MVAGVLVLITGVWHWFALPGWIWPVYAAGAVCYCLAMPAIRYRVHRWEVTSGAVYTLYGLARTDALFKDGFDGAGP